MIVPKNHGQVVFVFADKAVMSNEGFYELASKFGRQPC